MFFIGLFSSFIPYVVIAGIYLLGIGIYSIENRNNKCQQESNTLLVPELTKESAVTNQIIYLSMDSSIDVDISISLPDKFPSFTEAGKKLHYFNQPPASSRLTHPLYFCRPPPVFFRS